MQLVLEGRCGPEPFEGDRHYDAIRIDDGADAIVLACVNALFRAGRKAAYGAGGRRRAGIDPKGLDRNADFGLADAERAADLDYESRYAHVASEQHVIDFADHRVVWPVYRAPDEVGGAQHARRPAADELLRLKRGARRAGSMACGRS